jgi:LysR family hydrogen peroxide-inducible transcriptional activator
MVANGLGLTFVPEIAIQAGILTGTQVQARPLSSEHGFRRIALIWRRSSPREEEFQLLAEDAPADRQRDHAGQIALPPCGGGLGEG